MIATSVLRQVRRARKLRMPIFPGLIVLVLLVSAIFADFLVPHPPLKNALPLRLLPPFWAEGANASYLLGTDHLGRDILSRLIMGARYSLLVSLTAIILGAALGGAIGLISGYWGGRVDTVLMRWADATIGFPIILVPILLIAVMKPSLFTVVFALSIVLWARFARVIRGEVLVIKERDFVAQARVAGSSSTRIILVHLFPNVLHTLVVLLTLHIGWVIIVTASLSFLGAGIPPPTPEWGNMVADGRDYLSSAWWVSFFPGIAILLVTLSFNLLGDWLRDTLDPKLRQV